MKRMIAGLMALVLLVTGAVFVSAADPAAKNPVTAVATNTYLVDDDGYVDLTKAVNSVPYGETAYLPLLSGQKSGGFVYVDESDAASKIKVSDKWEESGTYVGDVEIVRKRVSAKSEIGSISTRMIYFLAIETKQKSATKDADLLGKVTLKQSGTNKVDLSVDIAVELGYVSASDSTGGEGTIPIKPASFSRRDGFEEETDYTFEFEADSNSSFIVNTNGQGTVVLGMNIDYDDDIGDKYPNADLYFFNGNYAQFNRTGTLYLAAPGDADDYYVYSISSSGKLTEVDADYDEHEECYAIRTNVLGRYVLSNKKLSASTASASSSQSVSSSSSASASAGSGSGELTVVPPPASSTPPASTPPAPKPSSSVAPAPPKASSSVASSSSKPSSSEPSSSVPEESSEPVSEPESEPEQESEPEEIVDVDTEEDDSDGPKKGGLSIFIWILIIVALLAVAGAVGFVAYASRGGTSGRKRSRRSSSSRSTRSRRRDDYDEEDEEDEEEYDEDYDEQDEDDDDYDGKHRGFRR